MKASELRIGNFVNRLGRMTRVLAIQQSEQVGYVSTPLSGAVTINQVEPIPLTEEWLLKFGFRHDLDQEIWDHDNICISYLAERMERGFKIYANHEYEIGVPFKYVHQLQNLYFALTGEELTIK